MLERAHVCLMRAEAEVESESRFIVDNDGDEQDDDGGTCWQHKGPASCFPCEA